MVPGRGVRTAVAALQVDPAQDLYAQHGEHGEHDRQDAGGLPPRSDKRLRTSGTGEIHGVANSNGTDTERGNTVTGWTWVMASDQLGVTTRTLTAGAQRSVCAPITDRTCSFS
ncbi:hypothetical protein GCM10027063_06900 [Promicromonospora xylanilytica]